MEEMLHKPFLKWYRIGKKNIGYEMCYRNDISSTYLAKARTNSLQLEEHIGRGIPNYDKTCKLCGEEEEDLEHFLIRCPELERKRNPEIIEVGLPMTSEEKQPAYSSKTKNTKKYRKYMKNNLRPP